MSGDDPRRRIPATGQLLAEPRLAAAADRFGRQAVKRAVAAAQQRAREGAIAPEEIVDAALDMLPDQPSSLRRVINATGVIIHTNLGRAPLSTAAREALDRAAGHTNVEFDLASGHRARRGQQALRALAAAIPTAQAVHVVNNNAAALLLTAMVMASGKEIVISRGELVEIGDGFRIPDLLVAAGARLREVGTTNRCDLRDYASALGPRTGFLLKVHTSNFCVTGFTASVGVAELATLGAPVVVDIGSGLLEPHPLLPDEPDARTALQQGADLVTCSADKLLGGPQAGLILGRRDLVERLRRHPAARALRVDKLTLAALEATLTGPTPPVRAALELSVQSVWDRAARLAHDLRARGVDADPVATEAVVGGGAAPGVSLSSAAVSLPAHLATPLRAGQPPIVGRVEDGRCLLDLRTVAPDDDDLIVAAVAACATAPRPGGAEPPGAG